MLYNNLSSYLKGTYGQRLKKICIDGHFTCPNRDGRCGKGGCIFCGERGAGEHIEKRASIREQVEAGLNSNPDSLFIAYFQNFTNTYADIQTLRARYDEALFDERIRVLSIGTRPDCINEDIASLIASYKTRCDVWVELGLQTASDTTAELINRGYKSEVFTEAVRILNKYSIPVVAHMMVGLPGEGDGDIYRTVSFLNSHKLFGLKIHSVYVMKGTRLARQYDEGKYVPITFDDYVRLAAYVITHVSPDLILHRITGDCPDGMLAAPEWNKDKNAVISAIQAKLKHDGLYQGIYFK
ncbi:MAG: TIGR01212 family radical SAM protein [Clostridia bacterium]|nr:TIGR01212 family radical SAM protein [Clostridia bacterium]